MNKYVSISKPTISLWTLLAICLMGLYACSDSSKSQSEIGGYPWDIPETKPNRPLSAAMDRLYSNYLTPRPEDNELYSSFKYTRLKGLGL